MQGLDLSLVDGPPIPNRSWPPPNRKRGAPARNRTRVTDSAFELYKEINSGTGRICGVVEPRTV